MTTRNKLIQMMEEENKKLIEAINIERQNIRLSLIEDYFKVRMLLAGWGIEGHAELLTCNLGPVFDEVYDMDIEVLEREIDLLNAFMSGHAYRLHGIRGKRKA